MYQGRDVSKHLRTENMYNDDCIPRHIIRLIDYHSMLRLDNV
jgi:hypothetical protein